MDRRRNYYIFVRRNRESVFPELGLEFPIVNGGKVPRFRGAEGESLRARIPR